MIWLGLAFTLSNYQRRTLMEYLGEMLGAGQLASGSLVHHSAVKEKSVRVQLTH